MDIAQSPTANQKYREVWHERLVFALSEQFEGVCVGVAL
jgi:hypothetical protein